ncbi:MAG TPA: hypothetical protein VD735_02420 [Candidatus Saccharimonadales bacterium]|nr:hypothetical protein [Candidatus Saccharimonadales bacterium]
MNREKELIYADRAGRYYASAYGLPPMAGRLMGYLTVCEPENQTIAEIADALMSSRSAVTGAIQVLENFHLVMRTRKAGERMDRVMPDFAGMAESGFDVKQLQEQAAIAREACDVLGNTASTERRHKLEEIVALTEFLARQLPEMQQEWFVERDALRKKQQEEQ